MKCYKFSAATRIAIAALLIHLSGCSTTGPTGQLNTSPAAQFSYKAAQLSESDVVHLGHGRIAVTNWGNRYGRFTTGYYVQTKRDVRLYTESKDGEPYQLALNLPIAQAKTAAIQTWGMFKNIHQLQIDLGDQLLVVALGDHPEQSSDRLPLLQAAYSSLRAAGVREGVPIQPVIPDWYANITVPVMVPR